MAAKPKLSVRSFVKRPDMPDWYPLVQYGVLILVVFAAIFRLGNPRNADDPVDSDGLVETVVPFDTTTVPDGPPPASDPVTVSTEPPAGEEFIQLPSISGAQVMVPAQAYVAALSALPTPPDGSVVDGDPTVTFGTSTRVVFTFTFRSDTGAISEVIAVDLIDGLWTAL